MGYLQTGNKQHAQKCQGHIWRLGDGNAELEYSVVWYKLLPQQATPRKPARRKLKPRTNSAMQT